MNITLNDLLFAFSRGLDFVEQDLLNITNNHGKRVAYISMLLCEALQFTDAQVFSMASCAILHDNALTAYMLQSGEKDFVKLEGIKMHCELGEENVKNFPFLTDTKGIILYHHENWDGTGFYGRKENEIPLGSAILRLADNLDLWLQLGTPRPHLMDAVHKHIHQHTGTLYSPTVAEAFSDTFTVNCIEAMSDDLIDFSLAQTIPTVGQKLSPGELLNVCQLFAKIIDAKSHFTHNHSQGTARLATHMGKHYGFDDIHCYKLEIAGLLHDIGKLATPLSILEKPGPLTQQERAIMQNHPTITLEILNEISGLDEIAMWAGNHHERLDGSGYGEHLAANGLCFECRLIACCDVYQALREERPYRPALLHEQAISVMKAMAEMNELDPDIVETMAIELREFSPI